MPYLKLIRDEPETQAPQPLPFPSSERPWRSAGSDADHAHGEDQMDSIARVEEALNQVENTFGTLSEQVEEFCEPIRMADWLDADNDGPFAA